MKENLAEALTSAFGPCVRETKKVRAWLPREDIGAVMENDQPRDPRIANLWLPFPGDNQPIPDIALQYAGESGRHSNTYASPGLKKGLPVLKLIIKSQSNIDDAVAYLSAMRDSRPLPRNEPRFNDPETTEAYGQRLNSVPNPVDIAAMPRVVPPKPRREAIPRQIQREVWQRDGGQCVECRTREKLCFDHIVPFSRGGSNSVRNLQLLCEPCNLSKSNRI